MKKCATCNVEKTLDQFDRTCTRGKLYGFRSTCKTCRVARYRKPKKERFIYANASEEEIKNHQRKVISKNVMMKGNCLEWVGYKDKDGYGRMKELKKFVHASRVVWKLHNGDVPEKMFICHKCDNPKCVNIEHLFLGTCKDNTLDAFQKGRRKGRSGEKSNWVKLKEEQVKEIKVLLKQKISQSKIGKMFNVSRGTICDIARGRNWKHVEA